MIKVVQFIHGLNMGGAEKVVRDYAMILDKSLFDVTVLCYSHFPESPYEQELKDNGIKVICLCDYMKFSGKRGLFAKTINHFQLYSLVKRWIHRLSPDVLHIHLDLNKYVAFGRPRKGTKLVYTQHFSVERWEKNAARDIKCLKRLLKRYPTQLIALNDEMKTQMSRIFPQENIAIINNGIDLTKYSTELDRDSKRKKMCIPKDAFVVVHVGRFHTIKNHMFLLDVFFEIKRRKETAYLLMVGSGETENTVMDKVSQLGMEDSVQILNNRTDVPEILQISDATVFPSLYEGLGIAVIEAQAAGLPCVASTGVPEATKISNKIRYLSLNETPEKWAEELLALVNDDQPIKCHNLNKWDIWFNVKKLENLYKEV